MSKLILAISPVIPVVTLESATDGIELARALMDGGISIIEVTLRTPEGLSAITKIREQVKGMCVGAGTVWTTHAKDEAVAAGAEFIVSPGSPASLLEDASSWSVPYLPGVQTPTEARAVVDAGLSMAKFFPAKTNGGPKALAALSSVLPELTFCPTGGIGPEDAADYLALNSVRCVGGSWVTPSSAIKARDWDRVRKLAREASQLG